MNKTLIIVLLIIVVLGGGYLFMNRGTYQMAPAYTSTSVTPSITTTSSVPDTFITTRTDSVKGNYLAGPNGMTLYTFDKDAPGVSNCSGTCAAIWPPYLQKSMTTGMLPVNIAVIKRSDNSMQYTWKNMPLYYYSPDKQPGDLTGDGFNGLWHIVKP